MLQLLSRKVRKQFTEWNQTFIEVEAGKHTMPPATVIDHTYNYHGLQLYTHTVLLQSIQFKIIPTQHILTTRRKLMEKKADGRE
jgi:hypothetical protein